MGRDQHVNNELQSADVKSTTLGPQCSEEVSTPSGGQSVLTAEGTATALKDGRGFAMWSKE